MAKKGFIKRRELYEEISEETDIPVHKVEEAVKHQFGRTAELMASGNPNDGFEAIRLPYFGKFYAKDKRVEKINEE